MKILKKSFWLDLFKLDYANEKRFARDFAWSWAWSLWPMIGIRFWLGIAVFAFFKQPQKLLILMNYVGLIPFVLMYFVHLRLGEKIWQAPALDYTLREMWDYVTTDPIGSLISLLPSILHAITGWGVLLPLYLVGFGVFGYALAKWKNQKKQLKK